MRIRVPMTHLLHADDQSSNIDCSHNTNHEEGDMLTPKADIHADTKQQEQDLEKTCDGVDGGYAIPHNIDGGLQVWTFKTGART